LSDGSTPVLEFRDVWLPSRDHQEIGSPVDLTLGAGDLVLVQPGDAQQEQMLADVACGLLPPERGAVRFLGHAWSTLPADQANALRGRIGHFMHRGAWIPYLSLLDNILLAQLHHTRRPYPEIRAEAARWATWFGLPGLPTGRPDEFAPAILQRAAFVRTFLGAPSLIIIESFAEGLGGGLLAALVNAMRVARDRDAAVLWFAQDPELFADRTLPVTRRLRLLGNAIVPLEGAA
jgi:phospholipid/cholesterol/gamma-HCH transport system ATP-binding protein